jgi:hypothetical protein
VPGNSPELAQPISDGIAALSDHSSSVGRSVHARLMELGVGCHMISLQDAPSAGPLAHPNLSTCSCDPRPMPSSKMFKSLRIIQDPKIHYDADLLRFCQHTRGDWESALFKDLALFLPRFSYRTQLYNSFFNRDWEPLSTPCPRMNWHGAS